MGTCIGDAGLSVVDLDADGIDEIVTSASVTGTRPNRYWYVVERSGSGLYSHRHCSDQYPADITSLTTSDVTMDGVQEIVVASGNTIFVYDSLTFTLMNSFTVASSSIQKLHAVDVDGDPEKEYVFIDASNLYVYGITGNLEAIVPGKGGVALAIGNILPDRPAEIVVANGSFPGYVLNGRTRAVVETYPLGLGDHVGLADSNGDAVLEVITARSPGTVQAYSVGVSRTPVWTMSLHSSWWKAFGIGDVDADGTPEAICVRESSRIYVVDLNLRAVKWELLTAEINNLNVRIGNVDGDSSKELILGTGGNSSGADYLRMYDCNTRQLDWQNMDISGPFVGIEAFSREGSALVASLSAYTDSQFGDGWWRLYDATDGQVANSGALTGSSSHPYWRVTSANVDADPQPELFVTQSTLYNGYVACIDSLSLQEQYRTPSLHHQAIRSMEVVDSDSDGSLELVFATGTITSNQPTHLYVCRAFDGVQEWMSPALANTDGNLNLLRVANVDEDPMLEIVVGDTGKGFFVFDGVTFAQQVASADINIAALETSDLGGDGVAEIIAGSQSGAITVRSAVSALIVQTLATVGGTVDGLVVKDVMGTSDPDLTYCVNGVLNIRYVDPINGPTTWQSSYIGEIAGANDSILIRNIDSDPNLEILMGDGYSGIRVLEILR